MSGLPGAYDRYDIAGLKDALASYQGIRADDIRANYQRFLDAIIPAAEDLGVRLCVHPDDPPEISWVCRGLSQMLKISIGSSLHTIAHQMV